MTGASTLSLLLTVKPALASLSLVLLPEAIDTDELLYYRKDEELVETGKDGSLVFHKGGAADFNTFFNSFSIGKWRKYTVLETVP